MNIGSRCFLVAAVGWFGAPGADGADGPAAPGRKFAITVRAGAHDRRGSLIKSVIPPDRLDPAVARALLDRPQALRLTDPAAPADAPPGIAEAALRPDGQVELTWFLPRPIPAGGEARFELEGGSVVAGGPAPWSGTATAGGPVIVQHEPKRSSPARDEPTRTVLQYNAGPTTPPPSQPNPNLIRGAYFHPVFSPSGATVTGDFSAYHPHHRGIFLAYVHTKWGDLAPDFWNIQGGTGRIVADGFDPPSYGPVVYRLTARHRWEATRPAPAGAGAEHPVALRERWAAELYDVPGSPYWLCDLTVTQQAEGHPLELLPYRYGGMAYRSAEPSVRGPLDVLTAEGRHRFDSDQKPTRWVDLTGPVAEGSPNYAGVMIADHPTNPGHPTVARIHPITLPFFSFVPAHGRPLTIAVDRPTVFRYRILVHDGRPDAGLNDRVAADFAEPAEVRLD